MTTAPHISQIRARGFTLVETLVAIAILMIVMVVPFYAVQQALLASYAARDQLIGSALAQEAVEYVYFIRDNNYLYFSNHGGVYPTGGWLAGLDTCMTSSHPHGCIVDAAQNTIQACPSSGCPVVNINASNLYTQVTTGTSPTRYTRTVQIEQLSLTEVRVSVTVTWTTAHRPFTITDAETLYNWL